MKLKLSTKLHSLFGIKSIHQHEDNYSKIEYVVNKNDETLKKHKNDDKDAHTTNQIVHIRKDSLKVPANEELDYLNGRFSNMVLGHNGDGINEVKDARVDNTGFGHPTLQDRLRRDQLLVSNELEKVNKTVAENYEEFTFNEYRFEPQKQEMQFVTDLAPYHNAVMQSFWVDPKDRLIYMTQAHGNKKDYILTRLKPNGQFVDRATVKNGGHGTHNAYRYIGDTLWIYSSMMDDRGKKRFVRFKYKSGEINYGSDALEVLSNHTYNKYVTAIYNPKEELFVLRFGVDDNEQTSAGVINRVEFIKASDLDKNNAVIQYKFDIPAKYTSTVQPFQGMTYDDGILYIYTGDSNPSNRNYLNAFDVKTGKEIWSRIVDIGGISGDFYGNFQEAEGVSMYYDEETGRKALLLGVTTGPGNNRHHSIYSVGQRGVNELLTSKTPPVSMTDTGGRVKPMPAQGLGNLYDVTEIGHYYLYTDDTYNIADFPLPKEFKDAGWFLDVYPGNYKGALRQVLTRSSTGRNMVKFERIINVFDKNENSPWNYVYQTAGYWEKIPKGFNKLSDVDFVGMTFYISTEESQRFSDFPKNYKNIAGWTFSIEQISENVKRQVLKRNNYESTFQCLVRTISNKNASKWNLIEGKEVE